MLCEATCHSRMHDDPKYDHGGDITECMVQHSHWVKLVPVGEPVYVARFGSPGDYDGVDDNEAYEAWLTLRELVEDGWLIKIGGDDAV